MFYSKLGHISLLVKDYGEALAFYTGSLKFYVVEDTQLEENKKWILVSPTATGETSILLVKAVTSVQAALVGNQCGNSVFLFLYTPNINALYQYLHTERVTIVSDPVKEEWGTIMKIKDIYGNLIEIIEPV